jgi:hypothetical protein
MLLRLVKLLNIVIDFLRDHRALLLPMGVRYGLDLRLLLLKKHHHQLVLLLLWLLLKALVIRVCRWLLGCLFCCAGRSAIRFCLTLFNESLHAILSKGLCLARSDARLSSRCLLRESIVFPWCFRSQALCLCDSMVGRALLSFRVVIVSLMTCTRSTFCGESSCSDVHWLLILMNSYLKLHLTWGSIGTSDGSFFLWVGLCFFERLTPPLGLI